MSIVTIEDTYQDLLILSDRMKRERFLPKSPVPELTDAEARMVALVYRLDARMNDVRSGVLAEMSQITPSALSQVVKSLVKKGFVERKHRSEDYRAVYVSLTDKGREAGEQIATERKQNMLALIDNVGEEDAETLVRILHKVIEYYDSMAAAGKASRVLEGIDADLAHDK